MKAFDVHCHIYDSSFDKDRDKVIRNAKKVLLGVLNAGETPEANRKVLELSTKHPNFCYASYGVQPQDLHNYSDEELAAEVKWIKKQKPIAISEIGLDYAVIKRDKLDAFAKMRQAEWFEQFLQLADSLKIPAVIHSRWATDPVVKILEDLRPKKAVLHAFAGTLEEAKRAVNLGYKLSIGNTVAYAEQKQDLVKELPVEAFLLETDSPVLGPDPKKRNEPANISLTIKEIAKIKKISEEKVIEITNKNVKDLFGLG